MGAATERATGLGVEAALRVPRARVVLVRPTRVTEGDRARSPRQGAGPGGRAGAAPVPGRAEERGRSVSTPG
ncbi:hypothetical protein SCA03_15820 [Streptomyces cacaoi]|uniref:Uncharacterized protein n=1 Tax=Streptomyces cacaoi TaxID=1898 RepID=A0A4Y3QUW5_STRCI|nr:hypothetical protein SCA03_15820 [Streptomyces cacaoi]